MCGAWCKNSCLLWLYLLVIILLFCFTVFAFVVTNKGVGNVVSERGYKEYHLGDYSNWLQRRVENSGNWRRMKSCLQDSKVCQSFADNSLRQAEFFQKSLLPIQLISWLKRKCFTGGEALVPKQEVIVISPYSD